MKDSYSFDVDDAGLDASYNAHRGAYQRIFDRLGVDYVIVKATSGAMGGSASEEFLAVAPAGGGAYSVQVTVETFQQVVEASMTALAIAAGNSNLVTLPGHLGALDLVYDGFITSHRDGIKKIGDIDPITEDILIGQTAELEKFQWFVRAHLESYTGELTHAGASGEKAAADAAR